MKYQPRHVVTMVVAVCAAAVLAPVGVIAATGTLTNIVDPYDAKSAARVTQRGTLWVESRAGVAPDSFTVHVPNVTDVQGHALRESTSRIAVTSVVVTLRGDNTASTNHMRLYWRTRSSGTTSCNNGVGWSMPANLVTLVVRAGSTEQLLYNGPPLVVPAAPAGQMVCLAFQQTKFTGSTEMDVSITGFTFK